MADANIVLKADSRQVQAATKNLDRMRSSLGGLGTAARLAAGALVGIGIGKFGKSVIDVGRQVENLQTRFKFLLGSAEEGAKAFDTLSRFAGTVPFTLEEIAAASGNLAVVSKDAEALGKNLELTANVAAISGLDFRLAGEQIQRALSGGISAADLLRERGIKALLGFKDGVKVTAKETQEERKPGQVESPHLDSPETEEIDARSLVFDFHNNEALRLGHSEPVSRLSRPTVISPRAARFIRWIPLAARHSFRLRLRHRCAPKSNV